MPAFRLLKQKLIAEIRRVRSSSLLSNAGWILAGRGISIVCQMLYFIFLARLLGSTEYGIYAGAVAMVALVSLYSPLGSHMVLLRYISPDPGRFAAYWGNALATTLLLGAIFTAALTWLGPHLARSFSWPMVLCIAFGDCVCAQLTMVASNAFLAFEKMRWTASLSLLINFLRMLVAGLVFWRMHTASALQWAVAAMAISSLAAALTLVIVTRHFGRPEFSAKLLRERTGEGTVFALSYSTGSIYDNVDKVMLGHYGMNAANGIYTMAYRVIDVACVPFGSLQLAASPRLFCKGAGGIQDAAAYAVRIVKRTAPAAILTACILYFTAPVIPILVGKSFQESVLALRWLCLLPVFRSLHWGVGDALTGAGHQNARLRNHSVAAAFNFLTNLYLIPHFGWVGAAWSSLATDGLLAVMNWTTMVTLRAKQEALCGA